MNNQYFTANQTEQNTTAHQDFKIGVVTFGHKIGAAYITTVLEGERAVKYLRPNGKIYPMCTELGFFDDVDRALEFLNSYRIKKTPPKFFCGWTHTKEDPLGGIQWMTPEQKQRLKLEQMLIAEGHTAKDAMEIVTNGETYERFMRHNATHLGTCSTNPAIEYFEHPQYGEEAQVYCIDHAEQLAAPSSFYETADMDAEHEEYRPEFAGGLFYIGDILND